MKHFSFYATLQIKQNATYEFVQKVETRQNDAKPLTNAEFYVRIWAQRKGTNVPKNETEKRKMKWNKQKDFSTYTSGDFKINKYGDMWEVYHDNKYIGARYTLKEAKKIAENYNR